MTTVVRGGEVVAGLSTERLRNVDRHLQRYIDEGKIAGALTLVARHGEVAHFQPLGLADLETKQPIERDTIFRIYSMTKPITSIALMQLYEQGLFQLDDPVHRYIPQWRNLGVFVSGVPGDRGAANWITRGPQRPMTVRDLLTHMSGLTYGFHARTNVDAAYRRFGVGGRSEANPGAAPTLREMVERLAELPLEFDPGTRWNYSVSTDICGYLVEVLSGQRFDDYLRDHVFEPLEMVDTGFHVPPEKMERFATCYRRGADGALEPTEDSRTGQYSAPPSFLSGGGGLVSTASDYQRFCQALLNGGELDGARVIGRKTLELMTRNHLPAGQDLASMALAGFSETRNEGVGFGLGFAVMLDPAKAQVTDTPGSYYWGGAASTAFWIDPVEDLLVVFMTQFMPSGFYNFRRELRAIVYGALVD